MNYRLGIYAAGVVILMLHAIRGPAQNLCPNPGFEQLNGCPAGTGEINLAAPWSSAGFPSDLFINCHVNSVPASCNDVSVPDNFAGNSAAHNGSAYAGFFALSSTANQRTYIQAPLSSSLVNNQLYQVSVFF